jgi:hypothetical protein
MGGWVGASDKASTGRAEKARVGGVGDTDQESHIENGIVIVIVIVILKTSELYRQAKGRNPVASVSGILISVLITTMNHTNNEILVEKCVAYLAFHFQGGFMGGLHITSAKNTIQGGRE